MPNPLGLLLSNLTSSLPKLIFRAGVKGKFGRGDIAPRPLLHHLFLLVCNAAAFPGRLGRMAWPGIPPQQPKSVGGSPCSREGDAVPDRQLVPAQLPESPVQVLDLLRGDCRWKKQRRTGLSSPWDTWEHPARVLPGGTAPLPPGDCWAPKPAAKPGDNTKAPPAPARAKEPPAPAPAPVPAPVPANCPRAFAAWGRCCFFAACWEADGTQKTAQKEENPQTDSSHLRTSGEEERLGGGSCTGTQKPKASFKPPHPRGLSCSRLAPLRGFILFCSPSCSPRAGAQPRNPPRWHQAGALLQILTVAIPRSQQPGAVCGAGTVGLPWLRGEREKSILNYREKHPEIQLGGCEWLTPAAGRQQVNTKPTLAGSLSPSLSFIMFKYRPSLLFFFCCCFAALK